MEFLRIIMHAGMITGLLLTPDWARAESKIHTPCSMQQLNRQNETVALASNRDYFKPGIDNNTDGDLLFVFKGSGYSFINQFTQPDSLAFIGLAACSIYALDRKDTELQADVEGGEIIGKRGQKAGDIIGVATNIPLIQIGIYLYASLNYDWKMHEFSMVLLTTHLLVNLEALAISNIKYHQRPVVERGEIEDEEQQFFNRAFRGRSSFPSGHMLGVIVLTIAGWDYYGLKIGLPCLAAALFTAWVRVEEGEHYVSDIVGSVAMAGIAYYSVSRTISLNKQGQRKVMVHPFLIPGGGGLSVVKQI